jgi:hypothetical protein
MGASCCSSKLSQVHCPSDLDRPAKESKQKNGHKKLSCLKLGNLKKKTTVDQGTQYEEQVDTTEDDLKAPDEAAFISVGAGPELPNAAPNGSPRTDRQVSPTPGRTSPVPEKPPSPRDEPKPASPGVEPGKPPPAKTSMPKSSEKLPAELPVVPTESPQKNVSPKESNSPLSTSASIETKLPVPPESPQKPLALKAAPVAAGPPPDVAKVNPSPSLEKAKPEVALPVFELQPVSVLDNEVQDAVDKYSARIHADFQKTFDCSWAKLKQEIEKCKTLGITLEWFWIVHGTVKNAAEEADGLVVIKVQKGNASKKGEVVHMSITGDDWSGKLPTILDTLCKDFFTNLSIKAVHITLWYSMQPDTEKFAIDPSIAALFKAKGFKWFQLTNTASGKRGQIMALKRSAADCEMPEELWGLSVSLSMFMPMGGDDSHKDGNSDPARPGGMGSRVMIAECLRRHAPESLKISKADQASSKGLGLANVPPPAAPAQGLGLASVPPAPVKGLGLANVPPPASDPAPAQGLGLANVPPVKGLGLASVPPAPVKGLGLANVPPPTADQASAQGLGLADVPPVKGLGLANVPPGTSAPGAAPKVPKTHVVKCPPPTAPPASTQDLSQANVPPSATASKEEESVTNQVEDTLTEILNKRQKGVTEIFSKDTAKIADAEEFLKECHSTTILPSKLMSQVKTWLGKKEGVERLICGGAGLTVDWLSCSEESNPELDWMTYLRVPVKMLAKSPNVEHPLSYLGTNDDEIFVIVWPCKKDDAQSSEDFLKECIEVIRNVEQMEDPLPFDEVLVPKFELQTFQSSVDIHKPAFKSLRCDSIHRPKDLVSVELTAGRPLRGALKQAAPQVVKKPFAVPVTGTGSFVFCIWHAKLDDLEEPLFLTRVDPSDWCSSELS